MSSFNVEPAIAQPAMLNPKPLPPSECWWATPVDRTSWYHRAAIEARRMMSSKIAHQMQKGSHDASSAA